MCGTDVRSALDLTEKVAASYAQFQRITLDRDDTDSFCITLDPSDATGRLPTKMDMYSMLPSGSQWVEGWRSFLALPFTTRDIHGVIVGAEGCLPHPSRGAFPVFRGFYVRDGDVSDILEKIASSLAAGHSESHGTYGVINSHSATPVEHAQLEPWLLRLAAASYRDGKSLLLRTALIAENELPTDMPSTLLGRSIRWLNDAPTRYLVASVPMIRQRFSPKAQLWLKAHELVGGPSERRAG